MLLVANGRVYLDFLFFYLEWKIGRRRGDDAPKERSRERAEQM